MFIYIYFFSIHAIMYGFQTGFHMSLENWQHAARCYVFESFAPFKTKKQLRPIHGWKCLRCCTLYRLYQELASYRWVSHLYKIQNICQNSCLISFVLVGFDFISIVVPIAINCESYYLLIHIHHSTSIENKLCRLWTLHAIWIILNSK